MHKNDILTVEKPVRYLGGEMGSVHKSAPDLRFILAFPDVYEVGMSHLGLQILYRILNDLPWLAAERLYTPWPDMERLIRDGRDRFTTLESGSSPASADILGFTLQYELSCTNILTMLDLAGIPLEARMRGTEFPLVIGGGPCAFNPEPLAEFFDAFLLGDGEEAVVEIASVVREWKKRGETKERLLRELSQIDGVYVPSFFAVDYQEDGSLARIRPLAEGYIGVRRRFVADLDGVPYPEAPVIPFLKTVHDRVSIEIARGCTRGCRFCQAGYIYRPVRERQPEKLLQLAETTLGNTGYEEVSLLSLSTGDYCSIGPLLQAMMARFSSRRIAVSFPSMRVGTLTGELAEEIRKVRKTGFTLAPEAGTERMRRIINKGISEEDLLENAFGAFAAGWRLIKLYFMIGLPGETGEELDGIAELARKVKQQGRRAGQGGDVNVSVGTFVPKPHTPFQWEPQIGLEETVRRQQTLRNELRNRKLRMKWHDARLSFLEGTIARGDRRLAAVIRKAWELGCRFDGWNENDNFRHWEAAFRSAGIDPTFYHRARKLDEVLPWDHLDCGVTKEFLLKEREKALAGEPTHDCRKGQCTGCGVCDFASLKPVTHAAGALPAGSGPVPLGEPSLPQRVRIRFSKDGDMRFLSHLEMINLFTRAVRRSGVPILYSQGFHPHPKFSFATALSVGVESRAEYLDMELAGGVAADRVMAMLNAALPAGIRVLEAREIPLRATSLSVIIAAVRYRVTLGEKAGDLAASAERFLGLESFPWRREKEGKSTEIDLRRELVELSAGEDFLTMLVRRGKPVEFAAAITGLSPAELAGARIEKLEVLFSE